MRLLLVTAPLALLLLVAWGARIELLGARPQLDLMLYMLLLLVAVGAACTAMLAACTLAVHKAFAHGYRLAQYHADPMPEQASHAQLHAVD